MTANWCWASSECECPRVGPYAVRRTCFYNAAQRSRPSGNLDCYVRLRRQRNPGRRIFCVRCKSEPRHKQHSVHY
jgi:hypothetical protein